MSTLGTPQDVGNFARAVRDRLSDLPEADVDDLTEGLEADLTERLADDGPELGDPVGYADELRHAAGLAPRTTLVPEPDAWWKHKADAVADGYARLLTAVRSTAAGDSALDLLASLRPVWWVMRGWVGYRVLGMLVGSAESLMPRSALAWLMLTAMVAVSVQWGRGRWLPAPWVHGLRRVANVLAVIMLLPVLAYWSHVSAPLVLDESGYSYSPGITNEGNAVTNVFAYGSNFSKSVTADQIL